MPPLEAALSSVASTALRVTFIHSAGVRLVLWAAWRSHEEGDRLHIDSGSVGVRRLLALTRAHR